MNPSNSAPTASEWRIEHRPRSSSLGSEQPSNPTHLGYRLPAEWEPHEATWLSWPHNPGTWPGRLDEIYKFYAELIRAVVADEAVHINVNDGRMERLARDVMNSFNVGGEIQFHHFPTDDAWCRDHGATIVVNRASNSAYPTRVAIDWGYNAWGGKYPPFENDNAIANKMAQARQLPCVSGGMVLEGGSIDVNGAGLLLTTESCLLNPNRNPHLSREQIAERLASMLGIENTIWLAADGIAGDDTDGHIDCLARFVDTHTVIAAVEDNPADINYRPLRENLQRLTETRLTDGKSLRVETLPMPDPIHAAAKRLPATYANFYVTNHSVLVPQFGQVADQVACEKLAALFSGRRVVGIDCRDVIHGLGAIHCLTQQIPVA